MHTCLRGQVISPPSATHQALQAHPRVSIGSSASRGDSALREVVWAMGWTKYGVMGCGLCAGRRRCHKGFGPW